MRGDGNDAGAVTCVFCVLAGGPIADVASAARRGEFAGGGMDDEVVLVVVDKLVELVDGSVDPM